MSKYDGVNKPELISECLSRELDPSGCTAIELRALLESNDNKNDFLCDSCNYFNEDVDLASMGHKAAGGMRGNWCRQFRCHLPVKVKACSEYLDIEVASDPNRSRTVDARMRSEKRTTN